MIAGPYPDALDSFSRTRAIRQFRRMPTNPDHILRGVCKGTTKDWHNRFLESDYHKPQLGIRKPTRRVSEPRSRQRGHGRFFDVLQWRTLVARLIAIKIKDTWSTAILMLHKRRLLPGDRTCFGRS